MKVLWICGLPFEVQEKALAGKPHGAHAAWSWVMGHLPPPKGVDLHIACRTARNTSAQSFDYRGARFHLVPVRARARVLCLFQFDWHYYRNVATQLEPDVIHGWGTEDAYSRVAIKLAPHRHLVQIQGCLTEYLKRVRLPWLTQFSALSERGTLKKAHHVVAENLYALSTARPLVTTQSLHVVEHPLRSDFLTAAPSKGTSDQIIYVGAIDERKGIGDAIAAFRDAAPGNWRLVIVGNGPAKNIRRLKEELADPRMEQRATHHPNINSSHIVELMQQSSVFLLPTRVDTGPTALKEAMCMGLWPVCYDNSGPAHYIRQFGFGSLAEDMNQQSLSDTLAQAIHAGDWRSDAQQQKIQRLIRPHFERNRIWKDLLGVYRQILDNS